MENSDRICKPLVSHAPRLLALDFETNGLYDRNQLPLPWANFPVSVAVYAVSASGDIALLFSSRISGALAFNEWAAAHHPFTPPDLLGEPSLAEVMEQLSTLLQPGDVVCCHNVNYDLERCLRHTCEQLGVAPPALLSLPRFCTCRSEWATEVNGDGWLSLAGLCAMFGIKQSRAHNAEADALALAQCLSKALRSQPGQSLGLGERLRETMASGSP